MDIKKIIVEESNIRLDSYLSKELDISRSKVQKLIKENKITVNKKVEKESYKIKENDIIEVNDKLDFSINVEAEDIKLDIVYEDDYLMVINKKSGMVVHPAPGNYNHTLVNALLYHFGIKNTSNMRPGIVHRLDKDTSGLMLVSKDEKTLELLSNMIKNKDVKRNYLAIVDGVISPDTATIDAPIGRDKNNREKMAITDVNSKEAITHIKVLKRYKKNTLLLCSLETGRTHQIRVHLAYINHPVVNDPIYNKKKSTSFGQMLHSTSIEFIHPITKENLHFEVDPPKEFQDYLQKLEEDL